VGADERQRLEESCVFIAGLGALGQNLLQNFARSGVGNFIITDVDAFSPENLTSHVLCTSATLGRKKIEVARDFLFSVNRNVHVQTYEADWSEAPNLTSILKQSDVVLLGIDSLAHGMLLYRTARKERVPIVDFYFAPAPNVFVTRPSDPSPEERLHYPSMGLDWSVLDQPEIAQDCLLRLIAYVLSILTNIRFERRALYKFLNLEIVPAWYPLVSAAASLMSEQAISLILNRPNVTDYRGFFLDMTDFTTKRGPAEFSSYAQVIYENLKAFAKRPAEEVGEGWFSIENIQRSAHPAA